MKLPTWCRALMAVVTMTLGLATAVRAEESAVELYDAPNFSGAGVGLVSGVSNLGDVGFRDSVLSMIVYRGRWELCEQVNYGGRCRVFGPGRYDRLPYELASHQGSLRRVGAWGNGGIAPPSGDWGPVTLYEHENGGGRSLTIRGNVANLRDQGFNDRASSIDIRSGRWQVCAHADYGAPCRILGVGRHNLKGLFQDQVSSLRRVGSQDDNPWAPQSGLVLYQNIDFGGREVAVDRAVGNLREVGFNDEASSIEVLSGVWVLCSDADYGGTCRSFGPGRYKLTGALHDSVSSVRPWVGKR